MILAGDIGGTKTLLALFRGQGEGPISVRRQIFLSRTYSGLEEILQEWLPGQPPSIRIACFGVAGPVIQGRTETTNLPWVVDADRIRQRFGIPSVVLLNDLEATAYGVLGLSEKEFRVLNPGRPVSQGNRAVIAAGTGLGEAVLFWDGAEYRAMASEGGHADFAPRNPIEIRLLEYLLKPFGRVSYERVLSGPGLLNIYRFLKETGYGKEPERLAARFEKEDPGTVITEEALAETAPLCVKTLDLFISLYGAEAGNLALKVFATGGVYIGGGIAPKIVRKLVEGAFMKAFVDKGRYSSLMDRIPVRIILNEETGLLGAARFGLRRLTSAGKKERD
ncbi:MAG: glucokinase [Nitrospirae bacterium]|nr:glucokinase [Nitrospirota bacterium]